MLCSGILALGAAALAPFPPQDTLPELLRGSAEALAANRLQDAIELAERYARARPRDARGYLALGDAYLGWFPDGRFRALRHYRMAQRLTPLDPVPYSREAAVGLRVGGADGERLAADGFEHVLAIDPLFPGAWEGWLVLFRNGGGRRAMIERLAPHAAHPEVAARIALLHVESAQYHAADSLLDGGLAHDPTNVRWLALRAQSAFEAGDVETGAGFYERALAAAARDSTDALWEQVIGIVTADEYRAWPQVPAESRGAWLRSFWARRNPDLFAGANRRVAEHFARWRHAREHYPLLHPLTLFHRSSLGRTLNLEPSVGEREFHLRCEVYQSLPPATGGLLPPLPPAASITERYRTGAGVLSHLSAEEKARFGAIAGALTRRNLPLPGILGRAMAEDGSFAFAPTVFLPLGFDLNAMDTTGARVGYNLATGLDDRGVTYLRFGEPDRELLGGDNDADSRCNTNELERWHYPGLRWVRFVKPNAFSRGERAVPEMVFRPMSPEQFAAVETALRSDATSEPAALEFGVWTAQFRSADGLRRTDVVTVSTRGRLAATLVGPFGGERGTVESARGVVSLAERPGHYALLAHAREAGELGRLSQDLTVRDLGDRPGVSDLLLARAWAPPAAALDRPTMLREVRRDLRFTAGDTIRVYAEIYDLARTGGHAGYRAVYSLLRTGDPERDLRRDDWPQATVVDVERLGRVSGTGAVVETLDLMPDRLPPGTYLLRVRIRPLPAGEALEPATIAFEVRAGR